MTSTTESAVVWWEWQRLPYNLVLALAFVALTARTWPRLQPELGWDKLIPLTGLALVANAAYCAAYAVELPLLAELPNAPRARWRWLLWTAGTLFALLLETYWFLDEILPPAR